MKARGTTAVLILLVLLASLLSTPTPVLNAATTLYFDAEGGAKPWDYTIPNWSATSGPSYDQTWADGSDAYFEGTGGTVHVSGTISSVNSLTFGVDGYTLSGGTITMTGTGGEITTNSGIATIASVLSGNKGLTKLGTGTLILSGANNYSGTTTIKFGTLRLVGGDNRLPTDTVLSLYSGATLDLNNQNQNIAGISGGSITSSISLGSGTLGIMGESGSFFPGSINGTGNLVLSGYHSALFTGINTYSGTTTINAGNPNYSYVLFSRPGSLPGHDLAGKVIINNGGTLTVETGTSGYWEAGDIATLLANATFNQGSTLGIRTSSNFSYGNSIGGCQSLRKDGASTLTLSAANDFTGDTHISYGTLTLANTHALQNSTLDNRSGTLSFGTLTSASFGGLKGSEDLSLTNAASSAVSLTIGGNGQSTTFSGNLTGKGSLIKVGPGLFTLTGSSTYSGSTTINEGIIQLESGGTLPSTTGVVLANTVGVGLIVNPFGQTIQSLNGGGELGGNVTIGSGVLRIGTGNYAGVISGGGDLSVGSVTLSGANTYLGETTVDYHGKLTLSGGDNRLPTSTKVNFTSDSILDINGYNQTIARISDNFSSFYPSEIRLGTGTLTVNGDLTSTFEGLLSGSGDLIKEGLGMLTFRSNPTNNSHTGSIFINAGKLRLEYSGRLSESATVVLADVAEAVLEINNSAQRITTLLGGGPNGGNITGSGMLGVGGGDFAGAISPYGAGGTVSIVKDSSESLTLSGNNSYFNVTVYGGELIISGNNYIGSITVNQGTLIHSGVNGFDPFVIPDPVVTIHNGTFIASGTTSLGATTIVLGTLRCENSNNTTCGSISLPVPGGLLDLNGCNMSVGSLIGTGTNVGNIHLGSGTLTLGADYTTYGGIISGEGGNLIVDGPPYGSCSQTLTGASTYTGTTTILSGTLKLSGGDNRLPTGTVIVMADNYSAVLDITDFNQTITSLSGGGPGLGTSMPGGRILLGRNGTLTVGDETDTTFAGSITGTPNSITGYGGTLIKQGSGTLTISGDNCLLHTNINEGTIKLLGSGLGMITLADAADAKLEIEGSRYLASLNGGGANGGNVIISGGGTLQITKGDYAGVISGNADLVFSPSPYDSFFDYTTILSGVNTYEGSTTIDNNTTLRLAGGDNRLPVETTIIFGSGGGTLDLNGQTQTIASIKSTPYTSGGVVNLSSGALIVGDDNDTEFIGTINGDGDLIKQGTGTLTLQGWISNASININEGCLILGGTGGISLYSTNIYLANAADASLHIPRGGVGIKTLNGGGEYGGHIFLGEGSYHASLSVQDGHYAGVISGVGDFSKRGTGTLVLAGENTFRGFTSIHEGILQLDGGDERLPLSLLAIYSSAVLDINGYHQTVSSLDGYIGSKILLGSGTLTIGSGRFTGAIEGEGNLVKQGTFTLTLSGANSYSGQTIIEAGTLKLGLAAHYAVLSLGGVDIQDSNAKLVFNYSGGSSPAATVSSLMADSYTTGWTDGQFLCSIADSHHGLGWIDDGDEEVVTVQYALYGDANLDNSVDLLDLTLLGQNWRGAEKYWSQGDFNYDGSVDLLDLTLLGQNWRQSVTGVSFAEALTMVNFNVVPEPGTLSLLAVGLLGLLAFARMRR